MRVLHGGVLLWSNRSFGGVRGMCGGGICWSRSLGVLELLSGPVFNLNWLNRVRLLRSGDLSS